MTDFRGFQSRSVVCPLISPRIVFPLAVDCIGPLVYRYPMDILINRQSGRCPLA